MRITIEEQKQYQKAMKWLKLNYPCNHIKTTEEIIEDEKNEVPCKSYIYKRNFVIICFILTILSITGFYGVYKYYQSHVWNESVIANIIIVVSFIVGLSSIAMFWQGLIEIGNDWKYRYNDFEFNLDRRTSEERAEAEYISKYF